MQPIGIRVERISTYLERRRKRPIYPVVVVGGTVYVSGLPPFDPITGEVRQRPFEEQVEIVLEQMKTCLIAAGSSLSQVVKCNVYCVPGASRCEQFNEAYARYFIDWQPARIFMHIDSWLGPLDIEMDCVAIT